MKSVALNIALIPPKEATAKAINLSKKLHTHGGLFILNHSTYSSHVTLYMAEFPVKNIALILNQLKLIAKSNKPIMCKGNRYCHSTSGYIDTNFKKDKKLISLQKQVVTAINPLRENLLRKKDVKRLETDTIPSLERQNIKKYGYRNIGRLFRPHLTLTKLSEANPNVLKLLPKNRISFKSSHLALFYLGEHGTAKKTIAKLKLG